MGMVTDAGQADTMMMCVSGKRYEDRYGKIGWGLSNPVPATKNDVSSRLQNYVLLTIRPLYNTTYNTSDIHIYCQSLMMCQPEKYQQTKNIQYLSK
jgi:hypothetical protein